MRSISAGSSMLAITVSRPPQLRQHSISMANTRFQPLCPAHRDVPGERGLFCIGTGGRHESPRRFLDDFMWIGGRAGWPRATTPGVRDDMSMKFTMAARSSCRPGALTANWSGGFISTGARATSRFRRRVRRDQALGISRAAAPCLAVRLQTRRCSRPGCRPCPLRRSPGWRWRWLRSAR